MLCMIASIDGATAVNGRSAGLGNDADRAALGALRRAADMILVGAGTARAERYGPPSKPSQRIAVVSATGRMDYTTELFRSGAGLMVLPESAPAVPVASLRCGTTAVDVGEALRGLADIGCAVLQVEGGPTLNGTLATAGLIDEINLTISPRLVGGDAARIVEGAAELTEALCLTDVYESSGYLFTRWRRPAG